MSMIAIITARGGSKRIPRKNIKKFMGKPMLGYAIEAARESALFDDIMVSTDDEDIAAVALSLGADIPFMRSARTSGDYATTFEVIEEVLHDYEKSGRQFDKVCCIYPCVPFLTAKTLCMAYAELAEEVNSVLPVCEYPVPVEWAYSIDGSGFLAPRNPGELLTRSQDLAPCYYDVGMFYFARTVQVLESGTLLPQPLRPFIMSACECQDIDTIDDWQMAEIKYKLLHTEGQLK